MRYVGAAVLLANFFAAIGCIALNKRAFVLFPFPAALTCVHYFVSWAGVELLLAVSRAAASMSDLYVISLSPLGR